MKALLATANASLAAAKAELATAAAAGVITGRKLESATKQLAFVGRFYMSPSAEQVRVSFRVLCCAKLMIEVR